MAHFMGLSQTAVDPACACGDAGRVMRARLACGVGGPALASVEIFAHRRQDRHQDEQPKADQQATDQIVHEDLLGPTRSGLTIAPSGSQARVSRKGE